MKFNVNFEKSVLMVKKLLIFSTVSTTPKGGPRKNEKLSHKIVNLSHKILFINFRKPVIQP